MAAQPTPDPSQQGASGAPAAPAPSQAPASPEQMMLARLYQVAKQLSQNPIIASGMQKVMEGLQEAQSAMLTQAPQTPPSQNPPV